MTQEEMDEYVKNNEAKLTLEDWGKICRQKNYFTLLEAKALSKVSMLADRLSVEFIRKATSDAIEIRIWFKDEAGK